MIIALDYFFLVDDILAGQFGEGKISAKSLFGVIIDDVLLRWIGLKYTF